LMPGSSSGLLPSDFPIKTLYACLTMCVMYPTHLIVLDLITRAIFCEESVALSSSLCSFLHSSVIWSLIGPNILLSTLFLKTLSHVPASVWVTKFHTHIKHWQNYSSWGFRLSGIWCCIESQKNRIIRNRVFMHCPI
jgi:hypothetical protein